MLRIPPGAPIDEDIIGQELEMGRTPVREAIKRLSLENLVTVFPRRGTFASEINITDLAHISDVRGVLEGHAAQRAAERLTEAQRAELGDLLEELGRSEGSDDLEALMTLDARVHRFIYRCAANPYLEETLGRYFNLSIRIWHLVIDRLPHLFARVHEHDDLLQAIAAGEADRARFILADHIA
ncbi:MAG TPA: GntR family transcriptional regulator, partial [Solirubrobacteraceae bacterium]|nr:GntR family transcriptional regulator [Solirubrobacteraceae bacterium]